MAKIRKRTWTNKKGDKSVRFIVDYRDAAGVRRSPQFKTHERAKKECLRIENELAGDIHVPKSQSITISEAAGRWLFVCEKIGRDGNPPVERSTLEAYEQHVRLHIVPRIGGKKLSDFKKAHAKKFREDLLQNLSRPMAKRVLGSLRSIFEQAIDDGKTASNPLRRVRVKIDRREKEKVEIPSRKEMGDILAAARKLASDGKNEHGPISVEDSLQNLRRYYLLTCTLMFGGVRISEGLGLKWRNVRESEQAIHVAERADRWRKLGRTKSAGSVRTIDIPDDLATLFYEWKAECRKSLSGLVFPTREGRVDTYHNFRKQFWNVVLEMAGLVDRTDPKHPVYKYTPHACRHYYASELIARGASIADVKEALGHSDIKITYDTYGHLFDDEQEKKRRRDRVNAIAAQVLSRRAA